MEAQRPLIEVVTRSATPVQVGSKLITLQARAISVHAPYFGFVWNRPVAVIVEAEGRSGTIPIVDWTRISVLVMAGLGIAFSMVAMLIRLRTYLTIRPRRSE